jgi:hypothetical protein
MMMYAKVVHGSTRARHGLVAGADACARQIHESAVVDA